MKQSLLTMYKFCMIVFLYLKKTQILVGVSFAPYCHCIHIMSANNVSREIIVDLLRRKIKYPDGNIEIRWISTTSTINQMQFVQNAFKMFLN